MEGLTILILLILIIVFLKKLSSLRDDIDYLGSTITRLESKIDKSATRNDVKEVLDAVQNLQKIEIRPVEEKDSETEQRDIELENIDISELLHDESHENPMLKESDEKEITIDNSIEDNVEEKELEPEYATLSTSASINDDSTIIGPLNEPIRHEIQEQPVSEPEEKNMLERFLTENLLSKIGIITFVLGIAFFVKYAIDQEWINEIGRVGIGLLTGGIIIGIAHKLRSKYELFSSILVGGGIATFYITITLAFREYGLFSQTVAFVLLIAITILSVLLSLFYDKKELAIFSLLGGFASPLMVSTGTGNYIVLFSYILILNTGMLIIAFKKKWRIVEGISYSLSLLFFWAWLVNSFEDQLLGATIFTALFFAQFYTLALFDHLKEKNHITPFQVTIILSNNLSAFFALLLIYNNYEYDIRGLITIVMAIVNAVIMFVLFRKSKIDQNLVFLIIAIVLTFVSLAIPIQLNGHVITMFWAAEMVILLLLWKKSQIQIFQIGFFAIAALTLFSYLMDLNHNYNLIEDGQQLTIVANRIFITGLVVIAGYVISWFLIKKEDSESEIVIYGHEICSVGTLLKIFKVVITGVAFFVPFLEINYQLGLSFNDSFKNLALLGYTTTFAAILSLTRWIKANHQHILYTFLLLVIGCFILQNTAIVAEFRSAIYQYGEFPKSQFLIHLLAIPSVILIMYYLVRNAKMRTRFTILSWGLAIASVIMLTVELDNIIAMLLIDNTDNYRSILYDTRTFGYPILWGIIAMILMVWGLNKKEVILRKISLSFFAIIIFKFYAYDVWHMSQGGRIASFVILGLILLLVSFLQQKIKVLIKDDSEEKVPEDEQVNN